MNDDFSCDERDMLDAQDFDMTTIDIREGLWLLFDGMCGTNDWEAIDATAPVSLSATQGSWHSWGSDGPMS